MPREKLCSVFEKTKNNLRMALNYELETLEDLVFETLQLTNIIQNPPTENELSEIRKLIRFEKDSLPKRIRKTMNRLMKEEQRVNYIQLQQSGVTRIADKLYYYLLPKSSSALYSVNELDTIENIYKLMYVELENLLFLLQHDHKKYFDHDGNLPEGYKLSFETGFTSTILHIEQNLQKKLSPVFLELICEPFKHYLQWETQYSFRELDYLRELQLYLEKLNGKVPNNIEESITKHLLYVNFNSVLFFNYLVLKMNEEASKRTTVTERVEYFSWQLKMINQTVVKPEIIYLRHLPPITDQLVFWIAEDIYYLNKKHQLTLALPVNREVEKDKLKKVHVQLTVSDLALGAKLLLDTEVIVNMNYTELMKLVARSFRTNRQANISQQAIYNVGFESSTSSKEKMKQVLMKMVRKMGEY